MIKRQLQSELVQLSGQYPVVTITGPRQSGKTTLARATFPHHDYVNLERPDIREFSKNDPNAFFSSYTGSVIIDEIQRVPELLSYIQVIVDEKKKNGQFILTGSNQLQLGESISQSLAGRTALLKLLPLSIAELTNANIILERDEYLTRGFLPRIYDQNLEAYKAYSFYKETYVERDMRQLIQVRNLTDFEHFFKLLAGRIGQVVNLHEMSNNLGVSSVTLSNWLSVLEASFIIHKITPYYKNFGKRLIKSPKIYFTEVGLATFLLGIEHEKQVSRDPLLGGLFENMVVNEILKYRYNRGLPSNLYFFRDNSGNEVDLILETGGRLIPIEIKSAMTFNKKMQKGISYFQKISPESNKGLIIYSGDLEFDSDHFDVIHFRNIAQAEILR